MKTPKEKKPSKLWWNTWRTESDYPLATAPKKSFLGKLKDAVGNALGTAFAGRS